MTKQQLQTLHHCVCSLQFHLVLVTKYRRKAITKQMLERLRVIFRETLEKWRCELIEFNGEADHVHLLFQTNPTVQLSKLINNLKTVSSRLIRRDFRRTFEPDLLEASILASLLLPDLYWRGDYRDTAEVHRRAG